MQTVTHNAFTSGHRHADVYVLGGLSELNWPHSGRQIAAALSSARNNHQPAADLRLNFHVKLGPGWREHIGMRVRGNGSLDGSQQIIAPLIACFSTLKLRPYCGVPVRSCHSTLGEAAFFTMIR